MTALAALICAPVRAAVPTQEPGVCLAGVPIAFQSPAAMAADATPPAGSAETVDSTQTGEAGQNAQVWEPASAPQPGPAVYGAALVAGGAIYGAGVCLAGVALPPPGGAAGGLTAQADVPADVMEEEGALEVADMPDLDSEPVVAEQASTTAAATATAATTTAQQQAQPASDVAAARNEVGKPGAAAEQQQAAAPPRAAGAAPRPAAAADALKAWWPAPEPGRVNLLYAGSAAFDQALVLLFDTPLEDAQSAGTHIEVRDENGEVVAGEWQVVSSNPKMLTFKTRPGRYTVKIDGALSARGGRTLARTLSGPIHLR